MKNLYIFLALIVSLLVSCSDEPNPCLMAEDFIKQDLKYPEDADFSITRCNKETNSDGSYTIMTYVNAKNAFGVQSKIIYKVSLKYNDGVTTDINNWDLINIQSEVSR